MKNNFFLGKWLKKNTASTPRASLFGARRVGAAMLKGNFGEALDLVMSSGDADSAAEVCSGEDLVRASASHVIRGTPRLNGGKPPCNCIPWRVLVLKVACFVSSHHHH